MADEKSTLPAEVAADDAVMGTVPRPSGLIYKGFKVGKNEIWYASPTVQLVMVSFVCFLCPGMFNALSGLGGGGQLDSKAQTASSTALYSVFAVVGFFAGTFANRLGLRLTFSIGGIGYCIYSASFLCYSHTENFGFVVFAGAFLGLCAGLLWTAQGAVMMSYPLEHQKGRFISWFWIIFNTGAVIGSLIPLAQNVQRKAGPTTDGTYAAFIALMAFGLIISVFLCDADKVIRSDGSKVILMKNPSWKSEFIGLWETLSQDPWILLLFPMFFVSNVFYTYQTNGFNGSHFNIRTRSLNSLLYWLSQIIGAVIVGYCLDYTKIRRSVRAKISLGVLLTITMVTWGGGYAWQEKQVSRQYLKEHPEFVLVDWEDGGDKYIGPMFMYFFYGFFDAVWQTMIYWYMGALSNSGRKAANLAGFYKGIQSAGAACFWAMDNSEVSYDTIFYVTWGLLIVSLLFATPVIWTRIQDTVTLEEDLKFSDETIDDVVVGGSAAAAAVALERKNHEA